jgi:2-haloacid dehalogenase
VNTVVFDLGGVLVDWDPRYLLRKVMPGRDAEMETILADVLNHDWNLARDHGDSWPDAIAELAVRYPEWADVLRAYDERWAETLVGSHEDTVAVLWELHERGVPLYALSNWSAEKFPHAEARYEWLTWFDGVVVSGRVKLAKPDPAIFRFLLDTYRLQAPDILFVDDHEPNIVAARALGLATHHFRDAARLRVDLVARGFLEAAPTARAAEVTVSGAGVVTAAGPVAAATAGGDHAVTGNRGVLGAAAGDPSAAQAS